MKLKFIFLALVSTIFVLAEGVEEDLAGFEDEPKTVTTAVTNNVMDGFDEDNKTQEVEEKKPLINGLTGKLTQQVALSLDNDKPHNDISSFKSSIFLDYEKKFENGFKVKVNAKAYYDAIYSLKDRSDFSNNELNELESEVELFDAYIEGKIRESLDFRIGRQVVVWGRSDTIRVTDILNPLDNRRPGMVDIEDLRLPVAMAKFDYFIGDWRITPIAILEQRFTKNPPFGGDFYPSNMARPADKDYDDVTFALSIGAEFSGWDINFYGAEVRDDAGYVNAGVFNHDKVNMFGTAINILSGSWLFKSELAYFDKLKFSTALNEEFSRTDALIGVEYNGIANTMFSYDIVSRNMHNYNNILLTEQNPIKKHQYQHAFRVTSDFLNDTLTGNYLISLYGEKLDEGGFQRAWIKYDLADGVNVNLGVVDYIGGSNLFDAIKDNDMVFADISYNF